MVPRDVTIAVVENELPALNNFAQRRGWSVSWLAVQLAVIADGKHHGDNTSVRVHADVTGYRVVPPAWRFVLPDSIEPKPHRFPRGGTVPGGVGSIFHGKGVICAPFNRLAYKEHDGMHGDWGGPENWLDVRGHVRATTLAEMLAQIVMHLRYSPGWN